MYSALFPRVSPKTAARVGAGRLRVKGGRGDARNQMIPPLLCKHEMHVRRPPRMAMQLLQQLPDRPIMRDGIADGRNRLEPKDALFVGLHDSSSVGRLAVCVLHVVVS